MVAPFYEHGDLDGAVDYLLSQAAKKWANVLIKFYFIINMCKF